MTLGQFAILNNTWAVTMVLLEVPSGALADTLGRGFILVASGFFMLIQMAVPLFAPVGGVIWLFILFALNRTKWNG